MINSTEQRLRLHLQIVVDKIDAAKKQLHAAVPSPAHLAYLLKFVFGFPANVLSAIRSERNQTTNQKRVISRRRKLFVRIKVVLLCVPAHLFAQHQGVEKVKPVKASGSDGPPTTLDASFNFHIVKLHLFFEFNRRTSNMNWLRTYLKCAQWANSSWISMSEALLNNTKTRKMLCVGSLFCFSAKWRGNQVKRAALSINIHFSLSVNKKSCRDDSGGFADRRRNGIFYSSKLYKWIMHLPFQRQECASKTIDGWKRFLSPKTLPWTTSHCLDFTTGRWACHFCFQSFWVR